MKVLEPRRRPGKSSGGISQALPPPPSWALMAELGSRLLPAPGFSWKWVALPSAGGEGWQGSAEQLQSLRSAAKDR